MEHGGRLYRLLGVEVAEDFLAAVNGVHLLASLGGPPHSHPARMDMPQFGYLSQFIAEHSKVRVAPQCDMCVRRLPEFEGGEVWVRLVQQGPTRERAYRPWVCRREGEEMRKILR